MLLWLISWDYYGMRITTASKQNKQAVRHHPDEQTARLLSQRSCQMNMWKGMTVAAHCTCVSMGQ
eukprot:scaffold14320_cov93-Skeletonema_marinoi.AAC.2